MAVTGILGIFYTGILGIFLEVNISRRISDELVRSKSNRLAGTAFRFSPIAWGPVQLRRRRVGNTWRRFWAIVFSETAFWLCFQCSTMIAMVALARKRG
jgi:hypothetical protein